MGDSNKVIARALVLSVKTIEKHRSNLMRKLNLHNTAAITLFAVRNGLTGDARSDVQFDHRPSAEHVGRLAVCRRGQHPASAIRVG